MQETWVQSLDQEDHPEKGMAAHSSILAWRISQTKPGRIFKENKNHPCDYKESDMTEQLTLSLSSHVKPFGWKLNCMRREGRHNPLLAASWSFSEFTTTFTDNLGSSWILMMKPISPNNSVYYLHLVINLFIHKLAKGTSIPTNTSSIWGTCCLTQKRSINKQILGNSNTKIFVKT